MADSVTTNSRPGLGVYLEIIRAEFLVFSVLVATVPVAVAAVDGVFEPVSALLATVTLLLAHVAVNAFNVASDYRRGIDAETDKTPYSVGSEVLISGRASYATARNVGILSFLLASVIAGWFVFVHGPVILAIFVAGAVLVVGYTDLFARVGLGEVACGLGLTALPTLGIGYVQAGAFTETMLAASVPMFFVGFNLLLLNEYPDVPVDQTNGRVNLPILLGRETAGYVYVAGVLATAGSIVGGVALGVIPLSALLGVVPLVVLRRPLTTLLRGDSTAVGEAELGPHLLWTQATTVALAAGIGLGLLL